VEDADQFQLGCECEAGGGGVRRVAGVLGVRHVTVALQLTDNSGCAAPAGAGSRRPPEKHVLRSKTKILMFIHFHFTGPMLSFVDYPELADHAAPPADRCFGLPLHLFYADEMRRALEKGCQGEVSSSGRRRAVEARRRCARGGRGRGGGGTTRSGAFENRTLKSLIQKKQQQKKQQKASFGKRSVLLGASPSSRPLRPRQAWGRGREEENRARNVLLKGSQRVLP